jgi:hypothetical protein
MLLLGELAAFYPLVLYGLSYSLSYNYYYLSYSYYYLTASYY